MVYVYLSFIFSHCLKEWAPYIGPFTTADDILNIKKLIKKVVSQRKNAAKIKEDRILVMLLNNSYLQVRNTAKSCKILTTVSKIDIMSLASAITINVIFFSQKMWGHLGSWLPFSCPHGVVYSLKFLLHAESCRDYVDGCLSMEYLPNIVVIDVAHVIAKYANTSRWEDIKKYGKGHKDGKLFRPYDGTAADPDIRHER